jgi:Uncharacterised protein family (UPF0236)
VSRQWAEKGVTNLEAAELGLRAALLKDGRTLLEQMVQSAADWLSRAQPRKGEKCHADRPRRVETIFGSIELTRDYLYSPDDRRGRCPLDEALGLIDGTSPGLVRLASRAAAREGFEAASDDLKELGGIRLDGRQIQRLVAHSGPLVAAQLKLTGPGVELKPMPICYVEADGTGIPMVARELEGRKGKQDDGTARTREVKLGCVFSQTKTDEEGRPVRDHQSTSYVGTLESVESFAPLLRDEARRRGLGKARIMVFIGDGAAWIWELARTHFPLAILILDFHHMMEYLHELSQLLYGRDTPWAGRMKDQWKTQMEKDEVQAVIDAMNQRAALSGETSAETMEKIQQKIRYLENNKARMRYGTFRAQGLFYGSGVVEAGCKAVIGKRLKQSGMFWSQPGAENIVALRCALMGHRWDECRAQINHSHPFPTQAIDAAA